MVLFFVGFISFPSIADQCTDDCDVEYASCENDAWLEYYACLPECDYYNFMYSVCDAMYCQQWPASPSCAACYFWLDQYLMCMNGCTTELYEDMNYCQTDYDTCLDYCE